MPIHRIPALLTGTIALLYSLTGTVHAQVNSRYAFSQSVGNYVPITGGTLLAAATSPAALDNIVFPVTLPFAYSFDNTPQTAVQLSSNGFLTFGAAPLGALLSTPLSSATPYAGAVSAFGTDLVGGYVCIGSRANTSNEITFVAAPGPIQVGDVLDGVGIPPGTTVVAISGNTITMSAAATATIINGTLRAYGPWSEMRHQTLGTAPNRVFVAQWSRFRRFDLALSAAREMTLNFQIRLSEGSGAIEIVYGDCSPGLSTTPAVCEVGLRGATNTFPADLSNRTNTKGVNDDWRLSVPGTANDSGMVFNNTAPANVIPRGLTYRWALPAVATNSEYGNGCYDNFASFYQFFASGAPASQALSGTSFAMTRNATGYRVTRGGVAYLPPGPQATVLALGDDTDVTTPPLNTPFPHAGGNAVALRVASNGFVSVATGNGAGFTPDAAAFLAAPQTGWWVWHDFNPTAAGSGQVKFEQIGAIAYVTWDGVYHFGGTTAADATRLQFQFDGSTGNVGVVFDGQVSAGGGRWLVGYSPGGPNLDPGSLDLATALPLVTAPDAQALALSADTRPVLGTTLTWTTRNIPASAVLSAQLVGLSAVNPGLPIPGATGCVQLVDGSTAATVLLFQSPTASYSLVLPTNASFLGRRLVSQSASLVPGANPLGVLTSNGVLSTMGTL